MSQSKAKSDKQIDLFAVRSLLFLPASNPRAVAKARASAADLVILDLEDAVKPADKHDAREAVLEALAEPWPMPVALRVNGLGTRWFAQDVQALARSAADFGVVPRAEAPAAIGAVMENSAKPVLAMIETAKGVLAAPQIASVAAALIAGTNDLRADLRLPLTGDRHAISMSLQQIVLAARACGIAVFDGVFNGLNDPEGFRREAEDGRRLGFDGKSLIHPNQIERCHQAFAPSQAEVRRARALVDAFSGGAERFDDEMIERMHVDSARRILDRAGL